MYSFHGKYFNKLIKIFIFEIILNFSNKFLILKFIFSNLWSIFMTLHD